MKVLVLTFPLINNYGGIIQAYALMKVLTELGFEPVLANLRPESDILAVTKYVIKRCFLPFSSKHKGSSLNIADPKIKSFIKEEISPKTEAIYNFNQLKKLLDRNEYSCCIVGSDQVFAKLGYPRFEDIYSLGFVNDKVTKIAYAASFGGGEFQGSANKVNYHSKSLKKFKAISVREESGVEVCERTFDVQAEHVLDPTIIIDKSYYIDIIEKYTCERNEGKLFSYILDKENKDYTFIEKVASEKGLELKEVNDGNDSKEKVNIEEWLNYIYSSDYIVTDSFHGVVFSIIFNKPFSCIINNKRGADRFLSLLKLVNLESRILDEHFVDHEIDWHGVNKVLSLLRLNSIDFLVKNLN
ncbi:polysaccharide pyruvyl transferase family protein [Pseudoalteromonas piscicida]|uniref:Polysaccharide pyruvyl transferase domain-containing protein n=1 Tax=Pseudoalteromonas piscicida TaxID=43662 RepID=A0ABN5CHM4_PSEO7|nr:polysaccharide pyruvyl transferase family protein [Pseudoalteromonas piscicida]ATD08970.1 hypothetical protein PPIS_a4327 [Pseudoalteromonas piscicida]WPU30945.1 polysaccharide pyruvyl transferase family protein [Pseudoalteromonas piscicida]